MLARRRSSLTYVISALCLFLLALSVAAIIADAAASGVAKPTMKLDVPDPVHVNKTYRIKASGYAPPSQHLYLSVWIQTEKNGECRKTIDGEGRHHAYPAIQPDFPPFVPVSGNYSRRSDKHTDTKANGHDYVCGYLFRRQESGNGGGFVYVLRVQKRIRSKP